MLTLQRTEYLTYMNEGRAESCCYSTQAESSVKTVPPILGYERSGNVREFRKHQGREGGCTKKLKDRRRTRTEACRVCFEGLSGRTDQQILSAAISIFGDPYLSTSFSLFFLCAGALN